MRRQGTHTIVFESPPSVVNFAAIASKKESMGPLAKYFDIINADSMFGQQSWEKAESSMQQEVAEKALSKARLSPQEIGCLFAGDLLNQCIGSHYGLSEIGIPFMGIYSACATMAQGIAACAVFVEAGAAEKAMAVTSSHFCSAERQFRFPLEYGGSRTPTSQWTVTGAGAAIIGGHQAELKPYIKAVNIGMIANKGIRDLSNMGAAMAPAAAETLMGFFADTGTCQDDYDLILTGDLAAVGSQLLYELMRRDGYNIAEKHNDCGLMIYDRASQDVNAGASGSGCCASVLCSYILQEMRAGRLNEVLLVATGALLSFV